MHFLILIYHAIALGIIQGLSEFLPISSSGHLIVIPAALGWDHFGQTFDVALHVGTLIALLLYFWRDLVAMLGLGETHLVQICGRGRFFVLLMISAIPGAIIGKLYDKKIDALFEVDPDNKAHIFLFIGAMLLCFGLLLGLSDYLGRKEKGDESFGWAAIGMGITQAMALIPGVSRSGITTTTALFMGIRREVAARFSFLISIPIVCGAAMLKTYETFNDPHEILTGIATAGAHTPHAYAMAAAVYVCGVLASAISGFVVIKYFIRYLSHGSFGVFVLYRVLVGAALIVWGWQLLHR